MRSSWLSKVVILSLACMPLASSVAQADGGFEYIFDGKSLDGWRGKSQFWSAEMARSPVRRLTKIRQMATRSSFFGVMSRILSIA